MMAARSGIAPIHGCAFAGGGTSILISRTNWFVCRIDHLNAAVAPVGDVDVALRVVGNAVRRVQLAAVLARLAERRDPVAVLA